MTIASKPLQKRNLGTEISRNKRKEKKKNKRKRDTDSSNLEFLFTEETKDETTFTFITID